MGPLLAWLNSDFMVRMADLRGRFGACGEQEIYGVQCGKDKTALQNQHLTSIRGLLIVSKRDLKFDPRTEG
jgi:hypothetical protein